MSATKLWFMGGGPKNAAVISAMTTLGPAARKLQKKIEAETTMVMYHRCALDQLSGSGVDDES